LGTRPHEETLAEQRRRWSQQRKVSEVQEREARVAWNSLLSAGPGSFAAAPDNHLRPGTNQTFSLDRTSAFLSPCSHLQVAAREATRDMQQVSQQHLRALEEAQVEDEQRLLQIQAKLLQHQQLCRYLLRLRQQPEPPPPPSPPPVSPAPLPSPSPPRAPPTSAPPTTAVPPPAAAAPAKEFERRFQLEEQRRTVDQERARHRFQEAQEQVTALAEFQATAAAPRAAPDDAECCICLAGDETAPLEDLCGYGHWLHSGCMRYWRDTCDKNNQALHCPTCLRVAFGGK
jgi:hypothetical protein